MRKLNHTERQYIRWCKYVRKCSDDKKKDKLFKQVLLLSMRIDRQRK